MHKKVLVFVNTRVKISVKMKLLIITSKEKKEVCKQFEGESKYVSQFFYAQIIFACQQQKTQNINIILYDSHIQFYTYLLQEGQPSVLDNSLQAQRWEQVLLLQRLDIQPYEEIYADLEKLFRPLYSYSMTSYC